MNRMRFIIGGKCHTQIRFWFDVGKFLSLITLKWFSVSCGFDKNYKVCDFKICRFGNYGREIGTENSDMLVYSQSKITMSVT